MYIYNLKIDTHKILKLVFSIICIAIIIMFLTAVYRVFNVPKNANSCLPKNDTRAVSQITPNNYTNILKEVHNNLSAYIGKKFKFTGYVHRVYDLKETQFVLARNMIISSDFQTVVVGFLCDYKNAKEFTDDTWVEVTGTIEKGEYHGEMPILKIEAVQKVNKPNDEYVYPPSDSYIPTSTWI